MNQAKQISLDLNVTSKNRCSLGFLRFLTLSCVTKISRNTRLSFALSVKTVSSPEVIQCYHGSSIKDYGEMLRSDHLYMSRMCNFSFFAGDKVILRSLH